ncbi:ketopantoate reductase family protein [Salarchaeum sp. JOR-1]|uniref:ketopantoate reductase family protein n=1 Tax=Salarchaeum sp. JOR-1 TaxID=2599399 RepID=UPI0011982B32|nr:ketopantoate reductase family protein [Salarchaeum sp. JOR-1]QDX39598.1 ketopantoate reductase family protein [Salarchaeum sp. JOR-1]
MRVAVLGPGAIGSLFGGRLDRSGVDVTLVGRPGDHVTALARDGLRLTLPDGTTERVPVDVTTHPDSVGPVDVVLVCVKAYDTRSALADADALLDGAAVCTFQNGLGNAETIAEFVPASRVLAGTTSHGATLEAPGHVRHAGVGDTVVGNYVTDTSEAATALARALTDAGIETDVVADAARAVWEKVLVNAGINAATALAGVPNGRLADTDPGERVLRRAVEEAAAVADAEGIELTTDPVAAASRVARRTAENRSSMRQDLDRGRRTEIDALNGEIVSRGRDHGIDTPVNETLTDLVRLAES